VQQYKAYRDPHNPKGLVNTITRKLVIQAIQKERQTHRKTLIDNSEFQRTSHFNTVVIDRSLARDRLGTSNKIKTILQTK